MIYQFYYVHPKKNKKCIIGYQDCKRPQTTKLYKSLETGFNYGLIEVYGYETYKKI